MAGLKTAPVTRLFRTPVFFTDAQIVGLLRGRDIEVTPFGRGGFPPKDVFHLKDWCIWVGSRVTGYEGCLLAFFGDSAGDPIFTAVSTFAQEITGEDKDKLKTEIETAMAEKTRAMAKSGKCEIWGPEN